MTTNWLNKVLDIGKIRENKRLKLAFVATPLIPEIINIIPSCGCTDVSFDSKTRLLNVLFKSGKIPNHVQGNTQSFNKMITVVYKDNTTEELFIKGTKIKS